MAVGDEEGRVRLLESAQGRKQAFKDVYLAFRPHTNAIIDMAFSQDDSLLATASGDQSARVVDMATQTTISILAQHSASTKQVRFQPGAANNSVLATSSRDGSVQIWDLRCKGTDGPVQEIMMPLDPNDLVPTRSRTRRIPYGCAINSIYDAHRPTLQTRQNAAALTTDAPSRGESAGRIGDVSVTAISFLPEGQEHMILTASEMNASVKLWDIRAVYNTRRKSATAVSCTKQPQSHSQWRHFGISSMNLSGNGSRLYTLAKDNTVYAYSTAHLVLGQAPELSTQQPRRRHAHADTQEGLGPLHGYRHPQLHATSFYVKSAVRPAKNGRGEMLAVGSSDGCAVLFPTDERYLSSTGAAPHPEDARAKPRDREHGLRSVRPSLNRSSSSIAHSRLNDSIPISQNGSPLIRGHDREVGALAWTFDGELVTVGDDFIVRCWREGEKARDLRVGGEESGRRWGCGWADVGADYDDDEEC